MAKPSFSPYLPALLQAHQYQGHSNDCGPFSAAIVINALTGAGVMGKELARRMNTPVWRLPLPILRRVPGWATFPWGVVDVLREYHLSAAWQAFAVEDTLRDGLKHGQVLLPILGTWKPLWAHILILAAYQDRLGWGFVNPAHERKELTWLSQTAFSTRWNTFGRLLICVQLNLQRPPS